MTKETTNRKLPYPEDTDAPDGPTQIKALAEALDKKFPQALVRKTTEGDTVVSASTDTHLTFPTEVEDVALGGGAGAMHSTVSNTGRLTCVTPGLYLFYAQINWAELASSVTTAAWFRKNGANPQIGRQKHDVSFASPICGISLAHPIRLA